MGEEKLYQFWLHNLPGVGIKTIGRLLERFENEEEIYRAGPGVFRAVLGEKKTLAIVEFQKGFPVRKRYEEMLSKNISFYTVGDKDYPSRLRELAQPPYGLYCLGQLPEKERPAAAVIGARECSEYGVHMAKAFGERLAKAGVSIISGMARGIDGVGQQAAIAGGGKTYAVLGCGVDVCYPSSNRKLYGEILERGGGILSVFPPGRAPIKQQFPERNRIVAGLSDLLLVVEARQKSGTWITVDMALEQGKNIYAVPGRITDRLSDGCNLLIRQGAGIALSPDDILAELFLLQNRRTQERKEADREKGAHQRKEALHESSAERKKLRKRKVSGEIKIQTGEELLSFLDYHVKSIDEILEDIRRTGVDKELPQLVDELIGLCMEGRAKQVEGNYFVRRSDASY